MAKTPIKEWEPIGIPTGRRYKREDFEAILEATRLDLSWRGKLRLRHGIEAAAKWYEIHRVWSGKPPPSTVAKQLGSIASLADRLLMAIGVPPGLMDATDLPAAIRTPLITAAEAYAERSGGFDDLEPFDVPFPGGETVKDYLADAKLSQVIAGIQLLAFWAGEAQEAVKDEVEANKDRDEVGRRGDEALNATILVLARAYRSAYEREPGISRPTNLKGRAGGPWLRFIQACLRPLGVEEKSLTMGALRERWRTLMSKNHYRNRIPPGSE